MNEIARRKRKGWRERNEKRGKGGIIEGIPGWKRRQGHEKNGRTK